MHWLMPEALWGLLAVPLFLVLDVGLERLRPAAPHPRTALLPRRRRAAVAARIWGSRALRAIGIGLVVLGLAQPEVPQSAAPRRVESRDIVLTLDISRSMRAEDFPPNRLEAAKRVLQEFVRRRPDDRIAVVLFAGEAFMQCPLTLDHAAVLDLLARADFSLATAEGTAIGDAIVRATERLKDSQAKSRIVVLITDGENNRGRVDPTTATQIAAALGIRIYTIGVGSARGVPIPVPDPVFGKTYLRNPDGSLLLTRLDEGLLRRIAQDTGGRYFNAADQDALRSVLREIDQLERSTITVAQPTRYRSAAAWFYLAAAGVLLVEAFLSRTVWRVLP